MVKETKDTANIFRVEHNRVFWKWTYTWWICQQREKKPISLFETRPNFHTCALKHLRYHTCPNTVTKTDLMKTFFILLNRKCSSILTFQKRVYWTQRTNGKLKLIGLENSCSVQAVLKAWNKYSSNKVTVRGTSKRSTYSVLISSKVYWNLQHWMTFSFFLLLLGLLIASWTHHSQIWTGLCSAIFWVWWSFHFQHTHRSWQL